MDLLTQKQANKFSNISNIDKNDVEFNELFNEWLIEETLKEIQNDVRNGDLMAIEGLLQCIDNQILANYLPEIL